MRDTRQIELKEWKSEWESKPYWTDPHMSLTHWPSLSAYATGQWSPFTLSPLSSLASRKVREGGGQLRTCRVEDESEKNGVQLQISREREKRKRKDEGGLELNRGEYLATLLVYASISAWLLREPLVCRQVSFIPTLFLSYKVWLCNFSVSLPFPLLLLFSSCFSLFTREIEAEADSEMEASQALS